MVVGHTKFAPDGCFGLIKQNTRNVKCLQDIVQMVNDSLNETRPLGTQDRQALVPSYKWSTYLNLVNISRRCQT